MSWAGFYLYRPSFCQSELGFFLGQFDRYLLGRNGSLYLQISSVFYPILSLLLIYRNCLQGLGQKVLPLVSSFMRTNRENRFCSFDYPLGRYRGVILCEPYLGC